ncbi:MAG TPA: glycoside hydrolase family protein [Xanthobacteraceae bacterium]|nr:glycoside hydrolase family protein [Xanthobacteraceae bacterium]
MKTSPKGVADLLLHEGVVTSPYKDSVGVWTYGVGHTAGARAPDPAKLPKGVAAPLAELIDLFRRDLAKYEAEVQKTVKVPLKQHEFDALVSFHFNTGAIGRASFVKKLNAGDRPGAAKGMLDWRKPPEILDRRKAEQLLFRDGVYSNCDGMVPVYPATAAGAVQWGKGKRVSVAGLIGEDPLVAGSIRAEQIGPPRIESLPAEAEPPIRPGVKDPRVELVQRRLVGRGYAVGEIDAKWGSLTRAAVAGFMADRVLTGEPMITADLRAELDKAEMEGWTRPIAAARAEATASTIADKVPTVQETAWSRLLAKVLTIPSLVAAGMAGLVENVSEARERVQPVLDVLGTVPWWVPLLAVSAAGIAIWRSQRRAEQETVDLYRTAKLTP